MKFDRRRRSGYHGEQSGAALAKAATVQWSEHDLERLADPSEQRRKSIKRAGDAISENAAKRKPFLS
jgi:hypothetical protein